AAERSGSRRECRSGGRPRVEAAARRDRIAETLVARLARHDRPAVVRAGLDTVDLVLAAGRKESTGSVLGLVKDAAVGLERQALHVAMPEREHRRSGERIVARHAPVPLET